MVATRYAWEDTLNSLAIQTERVSERGRSPAISDRDLLRRAYANCNAITKKNSHTFFLASRFLPHPKREGICALYSLCRGIDDTVDAIEGTSASAEASLDAWRALARTAAPPASAPVAVAWADTRTRFAIPVRYADQLINGVAADLYRHRYRTFDELAAYAYSVASTVGLMSMHVIGYSGDEAIPYAVKLGVALQITNVLRDVGEDFQAGRVYLPLDELHAFGLSEADLAAECRDDRWRAFMRFQIARNRRLYREAQPGIALLHSDGRFAIAAAGELYAAILADIEAHDYDVFTHRAYVNPWVKARALPGIWWQSHRGAQDVAAL